LAGYDTTATTLSFAAYNLAFNPDAQEKLYQEAKTILGSGVKN
jgi:cytochrome P450